MGNEKYYSEFSPVSANSPNGQCTIKQGTVGLPIAVVPMPLGSSEHIEMAKRRAEYICKALNSFEPMKETLKEFLRHTDGNCSEEPNTTMSQCEKIALKLIREAD